MEGRSTTDDDDHGISTGDDVRGLARDEPSSSVAAGSQPPGADASSPPGGDASSTVMMRAILNKRTVRNPNPGSTSKKGSKKRPCSAGDFDKPKKRPIKDSVAKDVNVVAKDVNVKDDSVAKDVKDDSIAKDVSEEQARPASPTNEEGTGVPLQAPPSLGSTSKKRPCPTGLEKKSRKRPQPQDSVLFSKYISEAIMGMDEQLKNSPTNEERKRTQAGQDDGSDMLMSEKSQKSGSGEKSQKSGSGGSSFDSARGGQQGSRARDRSSVVDGPQRYEFIMGDQGETRPQIPGLKNYIILKERNPDSILRKIKSLLSRASQGCRAGKGCSIKVPRLSKKQEFVEHYGWAHLAGNYNTYDMSKKMRKKTVQLLCVLSLIAETIEKKISITNRHVFYCFMELFGSQKVSDHMIASICCMFTCTKSSLLVFGESKGSVAGYIEFVMKDNGGKGTRSEDKEDKESKSDIKLTHQRIPNLWDVEKIKLKANSIIIVEKKSAFHNLVQTKLPKRLNTLLISGSGYPDIATRLLIKEIYLHMKNIPIYVLVDPDPHGLEILLVYAFGSQNMSYDRMGMAIPSIRWLPITPNVLKSKGVSSAYFSKITKREMGMLNRVLKIPYLSTYFRGEIKNMMGVKEKASLEALFSLGIEYMSKQMLPPMMTETQLPGILRPLKAMEVEVEEWYKDDGEVYELWNVVRKVVTSSDEEDEARDVGKMRDGDEDKDDDFDCGPTNVENKVPGGGPTHQKKQPADTIIEGFIKGSCPEDEVVKIDDQDIRVEHLLSTLVGDLCDAVINAYAHIISEGTSTSFISTHETRTLLNKTIPGRRLVERIAQKCKGKHLVFAPMHISKPYKHWYLLVLNFLKGEVQILNSIDSYPARNTKEEVKLVRAIQKCIDSATNITKWEIQPQDVPLQKDGNSCGAFILKYIMEWDGDKMKENFSQDDIKNFRREICSALVLSESNALRRPSLESYKQPIREKTGPEITPEGHV